MSLGLIAKKCGMTRIFLESGESVPVTVLKVSINRVTQLKTEQSDGYTAVQMSAGDVRLDRLTAPVRGHFAKQGVQAARSLKEFRVSPDAQSKLSLGDEFNVDLFKVGQKVDVQSVSKGKGFAGVIKRHNFAMQDATHGNSVSHRAHGSTGQCQFPGRVFPGKKMAGQMGNAVVTVQNQEIVSVDTDRRVLLVKGTVPGARNGLVIINPSVKFLESN